MTARVGDRERSQRSRTPRRRPTPLTQSPDQVVVILMRKFLTRNRADQRLEGLDRDEGCDQLALMRMITRLRGVHPAVSAGCHVSVRPVSPAAPVALWRREVTDSGRRDPSDDSVVPPAAGRNGALRSDPPVWVHNLSPRRPVGADADVLDSEPLVGSLTSHLRAVGHDLASGATRHARKDFRRRVLEASPCEPSICGPSASRTTGARGGRARVHRTHPTRCHSGRLQAKPLAKASTARRGSHDGLMASVPRLPRRIVPRVCR